jgi:hypothetical protein
MTEKTENGAAQRAAANKAIDEYYKAIISGMMASGNVHHDSKLLCHRAMRTAIHAYQVRCDKLGVTFSKTVGDIDD